MSNVDWVPELAAALDELVPQDASSGPRWHDVVARAGRRRTLRIGRARRSLRLAIVIALLLLLLAGVATATYLLLHGNGKIAVAGWGKLLAVNPDGPGLRVIASCPADPNANCAIGQSAWSPDGTRLAFVLGRYRQMSLYVAASEGGRPRRLAPCGYCGQQYGGRLGWSPDSRWIAFSRDADGQESLWVVAASGGQPHRITDCREACVDVQPAWSPDGHRLVFQRWSGGLYIVRPNGSGLTRIASGADPEWSPGGRRIVFTHDFGSIAVANANGSHVHVLFAGAPATGPAAPSWSSNGRKLVFFKTPGRPGHYRAEVWTMNANGSGRKRLYRSGCCVGLWAPPIWSPDGRMIAFSEGHTTGGGTFVINADGSDLRRLSPVFSSALSWQRFPRH